MNHRERVIRSINNKEVDRVPFDFWTEQTTLEGLIDIGMDILDPDQYVTTEMALENLKEKFSKRIFFHGGIVVQTLLTHDTPNKVKMGIEHYLYMFGNDGGYIYSTSHLFQPDIHMKISRHFMKQ